MEKETASAFVGVNVGYQGDAALIKDPDVAAQTVTAKLKETNPRLDGVCVLPSVIVYSKAWGCPEGGEVAGLVTHTASADKAIAENTVLRQELQQSTVGVAAVGGNTGIPSVGFQVEIPKGNLTVQGVGKLYQDAADTVLEQKSWPYVGAGVYDTGKGTIVIQGEANPAFGSDFKAWKDRASAIVELVGKETGAKVTPIFRDVNYTYLESPERIQGNIKKGLEGVGLKIEEDDPSAADIANEMSAMTLTTAKLEKFLDGFGDKKEEVRIALSGAVPYLQSAVKYADTHTNVSTDIAEGAAQVKGDAGKNLGENLAIG